MKYPVLAAALAASFMAAPHALQAEEAKSDRDVFNEDWRIELGGGAMVTPEYEGSEDYQVMALPMVDIVWRDLVFLNAYKGLGVNILKNERATLGMAVGYSFGRDEDDSDDLNGLGDVEGGAKLTAFAEYDFGPVRLSSELSGQISGDDTGVLADFAVSKVYKVSDQLMLIPAVTTSIASDDYMTSYFGVSGAQSARSGLSAFDAEGGFKDVGLVVNARYMLDENWSLNGNLGYSRLLGDAADSPITKSENQLSSGLGLTYRF